jgi:hypothetical protein
VNELGDELVEDGVAGLVAPEMHLDVLRDRVDESGVAPGDLELAVARLVPKDVAPARRPLDVVHGPSLWSAVAA